MVMAQTAPARVSVSRNKIPAKKRKATKHEALAPAVKEIHGKVMPLILSCRHFHARKRVSSETVKVDADKRWVGVTKKLLESDELNAVNKVLHEARAFLDSHALPAPLKKGVYMIPLEYVDKVNARLLELQQEHTKAIKCFAGEYESSIEAAKKRLGSLFDASDYMSVQELRRAFSMSWSYVSFDVPVSLEKVNKEIWEDEQHKAEKTWNDARDAWQGLLREQMQELVAHLVERLSPSKDGKKKIFRDSALGNLEEFLGTFDPRNIANDEQMKSIVGKVRGICKGVKLEDVREDERVREQVRQSFNIIKNTLDKMVDVKPLRALPSEDDE